jgi:hypothetical protein
MEKIGILLTEGTFTNVCKMGFIRYAVSENEKYDFPLSSMDMKQITSGKVLTKVVEGRTFDIAIQDIGKEMIREILMRSPVFSGMAYDI